MKIKGVRLLPDEQQVKRLGKYYYPGQQRYNVEIGKEYVVYCLEIHNGLAWVHYDSGTEHISISPLCLFEVIDGRVSKYWELRLTEENNVLLRPPSFYQEFFHDDLAEGVAEVVAEYQRVRALLEQEALSSPDMG